MSVAFVLCVEKGYLEPQAILLAESIRAWAGAMASSTILAYSPRAATTVPAETREALASLGVEVIADDLNRIDAEYPFANKIHACLDAESRVDADVLCFLDTDTVFIAEPVEVDLSEGHDLGVQPVVGKGQASTGEDDPDDHYWARSHALCEVLPGRFVETMRDRTRIRGYYNAGLVCMRRDAGRAARWMDCFRRLKDAGHVHPRGINNLDQHALAMVAADTEPRVKVLDWRYNHAIPQRARFPEPLRSADLDDLVHLHYHRWFNVRNFLGRLDPPLDREDPRFRWLQDRLPLLPEIEEELQTAAENGGRSSRLRADRKQAKSKWRSGT